MGIKKIDLGGSFIDLEKQGEKKGKWGYKKSPLDEGYTVLRILGNQNGEQEGGSTSNSTAYCENIS